jgi:hypothetical protein
VNIKSVGANFEVSSLFCKQSQSNWQVWLIAYYVLHQATDGERLPLAVKELGSCDLYPQVLLDEPLLFIFSTR